MNNHPVCIYILNFYFKNNYIILIIYSYFLASIQPSIPVLKEKFELLIKYQFLMRSTNKNEEEGNSKCDFTLPDLDLAAIAKYLEGDNCNLKDKIYWEINIDRFTQDFR